MNQALPSLQQLRFLAALVEHGHFGRAAAACAVTQSTLSGGIKELEDRLGAVLIERSRRRVMPTALGGEIAERARRLLGAAGGLGEGGRGAAGRPLAARRHPDHRPLSAASPDAGPGVRLPPAAALSA